LREKLVKAFQRIDIPVRRLQELVERIQQDDETVGTYAYEKLKLCNQMDRNMSERNRVIYFIQGLRKDIQTFVTLKEPGNMEQALQMARKKEESLIDIAKDKGKLKVRNIETQDSRRDQNLILDKLDDLRRDVKEEIEELSMKIRRVDNAKRGRKGMDSQGRIICHGCGKPGHYVRSCPEKQRNSERGDRDRNKEHNNAWRGRNHADRDEKWKNRQYDGVKNEKKD
jgi:hypothetical protein